MSSWDRPGTPNGSTGGAKAKFLLCDHTERMPAGGGVCRFSREAQWYRKVSQGSPREPQGEPIEKHKGRQMLVQLESNHKGSLS